MSRRTERLNALFREEVSLLIQRELKDPRLANGLVSITRVEVSPDLRQAKIHVSVLGTPEEQESVLAGLASAAGYIHRQLRARLTLRWTPILTFVSDSSLEQGAYTLDLMREVAPPQEDQP